LNCGKSHGTIKRSLSFKLLLIVVKYGDMKYNTSILTIISDQHKNDYRKGLFIGHPAGDKMFKRFIRRV
jgi:hypothetical protein